MKDRYVGDIGDLIKYAYLRRLGAKYGRLGVVWYLTPDNENNGDGNKLHHLASPDTYRDLDFHVFDHLHALVSKRERNVRSVAKAGILPKDTVFVEDELDFAHLPSPSQRLQHRKTWLANALKATKDCAWVFLDPDNGLEVPSCGETQLKGPKYTFYHEVSAFLARGQHVLVYQHLPRKTLRDVIHQRQREIKERTGASFCEPPYHYPKHRIVFFMIAPPQSWPS